MIELIMWAAVAAALTVTAYSASCTVTTKHLDGSESVKVYQLPRINTRPFWRIWIRTGEWMLKVAGAGR